MSTETLLPGFDSMAQEGIQQINNNLNKLVIKITEFFKREKEEIYVLLTNITEMRDVYVGDFSGGNTLLQKKVEENMEVLANNPDSLITKEGGIAVYKLFDKFGCSVYGLPNYSENLFLGIKIIEAYTLVPFQEIIKKLEADNSFEGFKNTMIKLNHSLKKPH